MIWGLVFIIGLQCGIEGAYLLRAQGAPQYSGVFSAWCDLRELVPLVFGYMMAAKVGTGIVAELGSMRISEEIDALEVMGISGITFLCATPRAGLLDRAAIRVSGRDRLGVLRQLPGGRASGRRRLSRGIFADLLGVPESAGPAVQHHQGDVEGDRDRALGCYYGFTASGGPVGVGVATAKSMVVNLVSVHIIGMLGTQLFWGANPRAPIGG